MRFLLFQLLYFQNSKLLSACESGIACTAEIKTKIHAEMTSRAPKHGKVLRCDKNRKKITLKIEGGMKDVTLQYLIKFGINRLNFLVQYETLKKLEDQKIFDLLIINRNYDEFHSSDHNFEKREGLNTEQSLAVSKIIEAKVSEPFCLFGPPGMSLKYNAKYAS